MGEIEKKEDERKKERERSEGKRKVEMMRRKQNDYGKRGKKSQRHRNDEEDEMIGFSFGETSKSCPINHLIAPVLKHFKKGSWVERKRKEEKKGRKRKRW